MLCTVRRVLLLPAVLAALLCVQLPAAADTENTVDPEIEALQREIDANGMHWTAKRNWTTDLSEEDFQALLGARIPPEVQRRFDALDLGGIDAGL